MSVDSPYSQTQDAYEPLFTNIYTPDEDYENVVLNIDDDLLIKRLVNDLDDNVQFWNKKPWELQSTDKDNTSFLLGDQIDDKMFATKDTEYVDNRLFTSMRAILSYATGQLAKPDITPSKSDEIYLKGARDLQACLYQHAADEGVELKTRAAVMNLLTRKRGFLKLRFDPNMGMYGDVCTEVVNPEDIIIDRFAKFMDNPDKIYHRIRCSVDELIARFPKKKQEILNIYNIKQGRHSQMSRYVTYFECWFTFIDEKGKPNEAVCWFIHDPAQLILDKAPNPNWIYTGDDKKDKETNVLMMPPKPFVAFNYINLGHSYIDETSMFDQAKPLQEMLNRRGSQLSQNIDFMNGRWVASKKAFNEEDAHKFVNKGARTIALVDAEDVSKAVQVLAPNALPSEVYNSVMDYRNEIDQMMGTPSVFKGSQPDRQDTLGRDLMVKQQAGALQDDLVRAISGAMESYYKILLQMMRVYYNDDYWFQTKGGDGKFEFILINGDSIDSNVKVGVQVDSTLPLDKAQIRQTAMDLWNAGNAIDYRTLMEDLGLPNPEIRTERYLRSHIDPVGYLKSVEQSQLHDEAEVDIMLLVAGKTPEERDKYDADYLNYLGQFMTTNRFAKLPDDAKQRVVAFLMAVQHVANDSANLQETMLDDAGLLTEPPQPAMPAQPSGAAAPLPQDPNVGTAPPMAPPVPTQ